MTTIAIDAMGGDHGLQVIIPACLRAIKNNSKLTLFLVGKAEQIEQTLKQHGVHGQHAQLTIVNANEVVAMDELPSQALRTKKDSSMRVAINLVKEGKASACVSAGNTGALMATARFVLKTLPGIDRPAIITELPTAKNKTRVIDLGANVDSSAEHLFQFAIMGSALIRALDNNLNPTIGLLNIGVEEIKGNEQVKRTAQMLTAAKVMNYVGYVEGDQFYSGDVDLIVCDGFVGNAALKASEGLAKLMLSLLKGAFTRNWFTKIIGVLVRPSLSHIQKRMDPRKYNGASLLGLNGIVVKSHGGAGEMAFQVAIEEAVLQVENNVVALVRTQITELINQGLSL